MDSTQKPIHKSTSAEFVIASCECSSLPGNSVEELGFLQGALSCENGVAIQNVHKTTPFIVIEDV